MKQPRDGVMLWIAAVVATAMAFIVHLALRFSTLDLGYQIDREVREARKLSEQRRLLLLEAATLKQAARIETVAEKSLGMHVPGIPQIHYVGAQSHCPELRRAEVSP